jgi:xylulokinase
LPPETRLVRPRPEWRSIVAERWQHYRKVWSTVTGTLPLSTLDETIESVASAVSEPKPQSLTRSVLT